MVGFTAHIYIYIDEFMTDCARYAAHAARDRAKTLRVLVPCSLWAILS
jgi:hypothetical protein